MSGEPYNILNDPEANVLYEKCSDVDSALWQALAAANPADILRRTGVAFRDGAYHLTFLNRLLIIDAPRRLLAIAGADDREAEFQLCLTALLYLLRVDKAGLGANQVSPKEFKGGVTFFQGPHALPVAKLEARYGRDPEGFLKSGEHLAATPQDLGDAALLLPAFPGLPLGVILWEGDEEFPAQVSLTVPSGLEHYWPLDAVWALLNVVSRELQRAGAGLPA